MITTYRVWDGEQMHYWDDIGLSLEINRNEWILWREEGKGCRVSIAESTEEDNVLMWGTGLKDKNGKGIYDKDIDMMDNDHPMIVFYKDGRYGLKFPDNHNYFDDCIDWEECEIGGDVYQNPELLEGAE
ncbi:YopX family protein [Bacillus mojavensis]|uniref:YopX family protein n=1 Tax=Bacillus mojavensis TaxID=72360 RepID=UPI002DB93969|nr:YopX family protein [Bacillus mojavensis]MEC1621108.1 YopX family protein [Bacillus mojavensis]